MADTLAVHEAESLVTTSRIVQAETTSDTLSYSLGESETVSLSQTLGEVEMKPLIDAMADTLLERKTKTLLETLGDIKAINFPYTFVDKLGNTEARKHLHTQANTWPKHLATQCNVDPVTQTKKTEAETNFKTLRNVSGWGSGRHAG